MVVGGFPTAGKKVYGGIVTSCTALLDSSLPEKSDLILFDSSQRSNPPPVLWVRFWDALLRQLKFFYVFESTKPDIVLFFVALRLSALEKGLMAWYVKLRSRRSIVFPRGGGLIDQCESSEFSRRLVLMSLRGCDLFLCQTERWRHFAIKKLKFNREYTRVIKNWTATSTLLDIGRNRCRQSKVNTNLNIIFVGWVEKEKGIFDLLNALKLVENKERISLSIVGDGRARSASERIAATMYGVGSITFHGWIEQGNLTDYYDKADVFILPSYFEGLPNSMIEAMAAGLVVIVTSVSGIPDIISHEQNGLIFKPGDVHSIAAILMS